MAIEYTFHGGTDNSRNSVDVDALGAQTGDAVAVADGAESAALPYSGLYRIKATSACRVRNGLAASITNGTGGALFDSGEKEVWRLRAGTVLGVTAA